MFPMLEPATLAVSAAEVNRPQIGRVHVGRQHSYWVVPAVSEHVHPLAQSLRALDVAEVTGTGNRVHRALWRGLRNSVFAETAFVDGEIAAMWGLAVGYSPGVSLLSDVGRPWLLTTAAVEKVPFAVVREARRATDRMLTIKPRLENAVLASYTAAIRMLGLIGFTVDPAVILSPQGVPYRHFHRSR